MREIYRIRYKNNEGELKELSVTDSDLLFGGGLGITLAGLAAKSPELAGVGFGLAGTGLLSKMVPSPGEELREHKQKRIQQLLSDLEELDKKDKEG